MLRIKLRATILLTYFICFIGEASIFESSQTNPITILKYTNDPIQTITIGNNSLINKSYPSQSTTNNQVEIAIDKQLNSQTTLYFISKDGTSSFNKELNELNEAFLIDEQDYWVVIFSSIINIDKKEGDGTSDSSQTISGIEVISFNAHSDKEKIITINSSTYKKQIGIKDIKDEFGEPLLNDSLYQFHVIDIGFKNIDLFKEQSSNKTRSIYIGRIAEEINMSFVKWLIFPSDNNKLKTFTYSYNSLSEDIDDFYVSADLSKFKPLTIDFSLPFLDENMKTSIGLQSNFNILNIPSKIKQVEYYGTNNNSNKNYHAVSLAIKSERIAQSPTFTFDEDNFIYLAKHAKISGESEFFKSYLQNKQIKISAQSTIWEQSVSYLVDDNQELYVLGFAKPYEGIGHYGDALGSSYKFGLGGNYKIKCNDQILASEEEDNINDLYYETNSGVKFNSIEIPANDCSQLNLEFEYFSYLNGNKYTSTSNFKFDHEFATNNAVGGIIITDIKIYEDNQLITNSIISKINPRLIIASQFTLFPKLIVKAQFENEEWIELPEITRSLLDSSVTFALPHSSAAKILNIKIIAGDEFETITHTLKGFAQIGVELNITGDTDGDGIVDTEDDDDDNDGINDSEDNSPYDIFNWDIQTTVDSNTDNETKPSSINEENKTNGGSLSIPFLLFLSLIILNYRRQKLISIFPMR